MRTVIIVISFFIYGYQYGQNFEGGSFAELKGFGKFVGITSGGVGNSGALYDEDKKYKYENAPVEGSPFLFKTWLNSASVLIDSNKYFIKNMNFNIERQQFMSKFKKDSVFIFASKSIDEVHIGLRKFKVVYNTIDNDYKVYEVVFSSKNLSLYKEYYMKIIEPSPNPLLNRNTRKIIHHSKYYLVKENIFTPFNLKKSSFKELFSKTDMNRARNYMKTNDLSYKIEDDVFKLFNYLYKK